MSNNPYTLDHCNDLSRIIGLDLLTDQGNKHVVVSQDYFSKLPMVCTVPNLTIVELLTKGIILFCSVQRLCWMIGTSLLSHLMWDFCS